jgi:hypothetical protein
MTRFMDGNKDVMQSLLAVYIVSHSFAIQFGHLLQQEYHRNDVTKSKEYDKHITAKLNDVTKTHRLGRSDKRYPCLST